MGEIVKYVRSQQLAAAGDQAYIDYPNIFRSVRYLGALKRDLHDVSPNAVAADDLFHQHEPAFYALDHGLFSLACRLWTDVLGAIRLVSPATFSHIHKGTPYFAMARAMFQLHDTERAQHYLMSSLVEDEANHGRVAYGSQAACYILCEDGTGFLPQEVELIRHLRSLIETSLLQFEQLSGAKLDIDHLRKKLLGPAVHRAGSKFPVTLEWRTAATAFLSYLLDFSTVLQDMDLASPHGGSLQVPLSHLFRGCHVLEMLLRIAVGKDQSTDRYVTLPWLIKFHQEHSNLGLQLFLTTPSEAKEVALSDVISLLHCWETRNVPVQDRAFWISYALRNALAHNYLWRVTFDTATYNKLATQVLTAMLWSILKLF